MTVPWREPGNDLAGRRRGDLFRRTSPRRDTPDSFSDKRETAAQANPPENNQTLNPGLSGAAI
ncbi:hypothetical protein [Pseudomonas syringae]|uniref:hypothetical protein n=1 Tax=Pseudomonas syringae TaxID=317 RepID=UPI00070C1039|nr:hypothetical protein [Pseudomonas syringae]